MFFKIKEINESFLASTGSSVGTVVGIHLIRMIVNIRLIGRALVT